MKSRGLEEIPVFDISEKTINGTENKPLSADEEGLASGIFYQSRTTLFLDQLTFLNCIVMLLALI